MKIEINLPSDLSEVSLLQYQEFLKATENNTDEEFLSQKIVSLFCNIPMQNVQFMKFTDVADIVTHMVNLFNTDKHKFVNRFFIGKTEFGFIPNLETISTGEYIDLENNLKDNKDLHKAMAVMFRPIVKNKKDYYDIEPYQGSNTYAEVMKSAPLNVVLGAKVFFWSLEVELLKHSLVYLDKLMQTKTMTSALKTNSALSGDGISQSINSLTEMLEDLTKLRNYNFLNV
jgi:hypothetical protein